MHKLTRGATPGGLNYQHGRDKWSKKIPTASERDGIWVALNAMQEGRCAYCEAILKNGAKHIEHFGAKYSEYHPKGEFEWANLFGSCNSIASCGEYKDNKSRPYLLADLIKPDVDDPADFFIFEADGDISPRDDLCENNLKRALETLRVFNIKNNHDLRYARMTMLKFYKQAAEFHTQCWDDMPEDVMDEINRLLAEAAKFPFISWIRHTLEAVYRNGNKTIE